uniref:Uncharacterized protein n=1 Tax=Rhipicephalus zambeziensis TaxID=60191 RepID=A0A224Y8Y7_9ACAR
MFCQEHLALETPEGDAHGVFENVRACTAGDTLQHVVALYARRMRVGYREVASGTVQVPRGMEVVKDGCSIELKPAGNRDTIAPPGAVEDSHHLAEWDTFTKALLIFHACISDLTLRISAVRRPPGLFYQSISLQSGKAQIDVEVPAYTEPYRDFMLPFVCHLYRLRNPDQTEMQVYNLPEHDDMDLQEQLCTDHLMREDSPRLNDNRIVGIMEAAMDMPSLDEFRVEVDNTISVPGDLPDIEVSVTSSGSSELRRLRYEVDVDCAPLLQCPHLQHSTCGQQINTSLLPRLCARRELTGSTRNFVPYLVEFTSSDYISSSVYISLRRDGDPSN